MSPAIQVEDLSKLYRIGTGFRRSDSLKEFAAQLFRRSRERRTSPEDLWALDGVSFNIQPGEIVGVLGRNGAGKSTLLKILSRITPPTRGKATIRGSLATLLEVGTGFHPELSGRENIFLNGAILGMSRAQIRARFDEITAFAEIEKFLDTPVKHYSSGMFIRLAFSVAAHLEADVLLVDEVLAVGDIPFQKKCLSKMGTVANQGRTIVFVSHNLLALRQLCPRSLLIDKGKLVFDGPTHQALRHFNENLQKEKIGENSHLGERLSGHSGAVRFTSFEFRDIHGNEKYNFEPGETIRVHFTYRAHETVPDLKLKFSLLSETSAEAVTSFDFVLSREPIAKGREGCVTLEIPNPPLLAREYHPYIWLGNVFGNPFDRLVYPITSIPPLNIVSRHAEPAHHDGFVQLPAHLIEMGI